jgi:LysM repeat protein
MSKSTYIFSFLVVAQLFLISADVKIDKTLYYFNSLKSLEGVKISHSPGVYNTSINLTIDLGSVKDLEIQTITSHGYKRVDKSISITEPTVLRIRYTDNEGNKRNFTGNYIVNANHQIPIVALVVDSNDFFPPNGIYEGRMEANPNGGEPIKIGKAWNKQPITGYAQFFFNNKLVEELELDIKTYGGMTLGWKEKSLQLSARKTLHGEGKINVKLFENNPQREFQHVVLRTSGNDQNKSRVKDMSISHVADDVNVNTKASRQVALYINGQYWGIHNLREKVNGDYFEERYNWKKNEFLEIQGSGFGNPVYRSLIDYAREHSGDKNFHQRISDSIDVENFFNFNIVQTYISNVDYRGNVRFFKKKGGKWKWLVYDTDLACGNQFLTRNFIRDRTFPVHEYWYNPDYAVTLLKNMLKNADFKKRFINQYCYLMATYVQPENFSAKIDANIAKIEKELERHLNRRGNLYNESKASWNGQVKSIKGYFNKRQESAYRHLQETFELSDAVELSVSQNLPHFKGLTMNGSEVYTNRINGKFFKELNVELEAKNRDHLYEFVKWSDGEKSLKRSITPGNVKTYKAEFKHVAPSAAWKDKIVIDKYFVNNDWKEPLIFVSITNRTSEDLKLDNFTMYEDKSGSELSLKGKVVKSGKSLVLTNDCEFFKKNVKKKEVEVVNFMDGMAFVDEVKFVLIENGKGWVDSLQAEVNDSMLIEHASYLVSKDAGKVIIEHKKMKDLEKLKFGSEIKFKVGNTTAEVWLKIVLLSIVGALIALFGWFIYRRRKQRNNASMLLALIFLSGTTLAQAPIDTSDSVEIRSDRFGLQSIESRVIDNKGKGDERFNGTRNFRVVLYDLVYRGGGNNLHLKDTIPKYYLWNPMPLYGLRQLQDVGFDKAVYLYSYNFEYWYPEKRLDSLNAEGFDYVCEPSVGDEYLPKYFSDVVERANDTTMGMMYIHCWNGWHQSGLLSAYTLMQFCDYSNSEALKYWERCTDGNYKGFATVKRKIREYKRYADYSFTDEQKKKYCPCTKDVSESAATQSEEDKINLSAEEMMEKKSNSSSTKYSYHTIRSGENLGVIAEKYGMGLSELQRLNGIRGSTIYAGQKLKVIDRKGVSKSNQTSEKSSSSSKTHKVRSGDSLYGIALKYHTTVDGIKKANNLKDDLIHPGQILKLP